MPTRREFVCVTTAAVLSVVGSAVAQTSGTPAQTDGGPSPESGQAEGSDGDDMARYNTRVAIAQSVPFPT